MAAQYPVTWVFTLVCLAFALWSFVTITHDADRMYYDQRDPSNPIICVHAGVELCPVV